MKYDRYCPSTINKVTHPHLINISKCWQTSDGVYDILYDLIAGYRHLRIKRIDGRPIHNFMDMQQIKNDLLGSEQVAVEIYPAQSNFKNGSNTYHLWSWSGLKVPDLNKLYSYSDITKPQPTSTQQTNGAMFDLSNRYFDEVNVDGLNRSVIEVFVEWCQTQRH